MNMREHKGGIYGKDQRKERKGRNFYNFFYFENKNKEINNRNKIIKNKGKYNR